MTISNRRTSVAHLALALIAAMSARSALPAEPPAKPPTVTITSPGDGNVSLFINETLDMAAKIENAKPLPDKSKTLYNYAGTSQIPANYTIQWTCTAGSYLESYSPTTTFMNVSDIDAPKIEISFNAAAVELRTGPPATPASKPVATATAPTAPKADQKPRLPYPASTFLPDELSAEIKATMDAPDRDGRVQRLRAALAQRVDDPLAIVLEFNIATQLGQNPDPGHHQEARPLEALVVLEHIVGHYDHKVYYTPETSGETCSPRFMVPRAAIMAASIDNGLVHDAPAAKAYAFAAMDSLDWTFQKRTADWTNTPRPDPMPAPFNGGTEEAKYQSRVAGWEKRKVDAAAGRAIGPYEKELAQAAVRQYGLSFGPQTPEEVIPVMRAAHRAATTAPRLPPPHRNISTSAKRSPRSRHKFLPPRRRAASLTSGST